MLIAYIIVSLFISWIWVDYYRLIDVYDKEKFAPFVVNFLLGGASVFIVLGIHEILLEPVGFEMNGNVLNDFLFSSFGIGAVEELAKVTPFIIVSAVYKKLFNDPLDIVAYICTAALGFSAVENVLYFHNHGADIITSRAVLSTVSHMFDSSLVAYGIILYRYREGYKKILYPIGLFLFAAISHGIYDFWLLYEGFKDFGWLITILYFFVTLSFFATILNNALNNSNHFTYKNVVDSHRVIKLLSIYYLVLFGAQMVLAAVETGNVGLSIARTLFGSLILVFILSVVIIRLSRFKLIHLRWDPLKFEMPFIINHEEIDGGRKVYRKIKVRGDEYNMALMHQYYHEYFTIKPLSKRTPLLQGVKTAYIEEKIFDKNDRGYFKAKIYKNETLEDFYIVYLKPKILGASTVNKKFPIVSVNILKEDTGIEKVKFVEWAYLKM